MTLFLLSIVLLSCKAEKVDLGLHLEKGKEYKQKMNAKSTVVQEINGQKMVIDMSIQGTMTYLVKNIKADVYDLDVTYVTLAMSMQLPQGLIEFSSEKTDDNNVFSKMLADMVNKPFQISMSGTGKIIEVNNIELLFESVFSKFTQIPEEQLSQLKAQLQKAYGEEAFRGNIEMVTAIYPEKAVEKGESWVIKTKLESGMSADVTTTYQYAESESDYYLIKGNSKIETADKDAYIEANGMPMRYELSGEMQSEIKVDKVTGWIIEANIKQGMKGDVYVKGNPKLPGGMKIPMVIKNDMTYSNN